MHSTALRARAEKGSGWMGTHLGSKTPDLVRLSLEVFLRLSARRCERFFFSFVSSKKVKSS